MSAAISSLTGLQNFSLLSIPAVWVVSISAHFYAITLTKGRFTNASPRDYLAAISRKQNKSAIDHKYIRAEAAQQNGFENLGLYAAAIVAGHIAKLPSGQLNSLALGYVASRVLFNILYIFVTSETVGESWRKRRVLPQHTRRADPRVLETSPSQPPIHHVHRWHRHHFQALHLQCLCAFREPKVAVSTVMDGRADGMLCGFTRR